MAPLQTVQSGFYSGETILELERLALWELGNVIGTSVDYGRFPRWLLRKHFNNRQNKFVFESECIKKFALILCKNTYRQYKLPLNCIDGGVLAAKYYITSTSYEDLDIVDLEYMNDRMQGYLIEGDSQPEYAWMGDSYGNIPILEVHPAPDSDGTAYTVSPDTGVTVGGDLPGATSNVSGSASGGSATTLDDTTVDFTSMGLVAGMSVQNVTDGSAAVILSVATTKITFASALTGGTANTFSAGDSYEILAGEYGVLTDWENDERYIFGSEVGVLSQITVPAGNIRIDYIPYPLTFPASGNDGQYPEIPKLYHMDYAMGVVADCLRTFHEKSKEFQRAAFYEAIFMAAVATAKGARQARPFRKKPVRIVPRIK